MLEDDPLETKPCTHMGAYGSVDGVEVVCAADTDAARLAAFGARYGVGALYDDYRRMLRMERPDVVSICAWATDRAAMVMEAIDAGVRGIWCEKAMAASLDEARAMADAAGRAGVVMIVSHMRRWCPRYRKAKEMIEGGVIGRLQSIVAHFSGSLLHTGTHAFDVLRWFAGEARWVEGALEERGGRAFEWELADDRGGRAVIGFDDGVYATVHGESKGYFFFEFDVIGSHGRIRIGNNDVLRLYRPAPSRHYTGLLELDGAPFPGFEERNIWTAALEDLIGCMRGEAENPSGPEDGLRALEMALGVHVSHGLGGARVELPLEVTGARVASR